MKDRSDRLKFILRLLSPIAAALIGGLLFLFWISFISVQASSNANQNKTLQSSLPAENSEQIVLHPFRKLESSGRERSVLQQSDPFDIAITKSQLPQPFTVGSNNRYILNVTRVNTNTITATVIVSDSLPLGMTWTPPTTAGNWDCTSSTTRVVSCFYAAAIPPSLTAFEPINIVVNVASNIQADTVINRAELINGGSDVSNDWDEVTTIIRSADLQLGKVQSPAAVPIVGTVISYTLTVTNAGPTIAESVIVTETQPKYLSEYTVISPIGASFTVGPDDIWTWNVGNIPSTSGSNVRQLVIAATVEDESTSDRASGKQVTNEARVSSSTHDWNTSNNSASTTFVVGGLEIEKKVSSENVYAGEPFDYTIVVTNTSPNQISSILVSDTFTSSLSIVNCRIQYVSSSGTCFVGSNNLLNSSLSIPGSQTARLIVTARGNENINNLIQTITNTASVSWGSPRFTLRSNTVETTISPAGQIQVGKTDGLSTVSPGQSITYTISITNIGSLATQPGTLIVTDTLLNNLDYVTVNKNGLTMNDLVQSGNTRSWVFPSKSLNPGEKISFFIGAKVHSRPEGTETVNRVDGTFRDLTGRQTYSSGTERSTITSSPTTKMSIVKSVTPEQAQVGDTLTFRIEVRNTGDDDAEDIIVNDFFPDVLDLTGATTSRGTAELSTTTREVEVRIDDMEPDERTTIVITARVNSTVTTARTYRNRAYVSWAGSGGELATGPVAYRVYPSGTLPGTGTVGAAGSGAAAASINLIVGFGGVILLAVSLFLLGYGLWMRRRHPLSAGGYLRSGFGFLFVAVLCGLAAFFFQPGSSEPRKLSMLSGAKPPLATAEPVLPASTHQPKKTATRPELEPEEPGELLPLRPTPSEILEATDPSQPTPTLTSGEIDISHLFPTPTPLYLPDFPIPTPTGTVLSGPNGSDPDSTAVTHLEIPRLRLNTIVKYVPFNGSTWLISGLKQEIAWMGNTSWPGLGGNTGLAGHVDLVTGEKGPFWNLGELKVGDEILVYTQQRIYTYQVRKQAIVDDTDLSVIGATDHPQITLITCTGWDNTIRAYLKRLIVFADLVKIQPLSAASN